MSVLAKERQEMKEIFRRENKALRKENAILHEEDGKLQKEIAKLRAENEKLHQADSKIEKAIRQRSKFYFLKLRACVVLRKPLWPVNLSGSDREDTRG